MKLAQVQPARVSSLERLERGESKFREELVRDVWVTCSLCGKVVPAPGAWADLEGPPFRAYFCHWCAIPLLSGKQTVTQGGFR